MTTIEQAVADYWHDIRLPKDRIQALKDAVLADFEGRHVQGEAEVASQCKRLARLEHERTKAKKAYYDDALTLVEFKLEQERINQEVKAAQTAIDQWTIEMEAIRRSLDEALSLLVDPHRLYVEAPEGINLMLVQAVCEKIWILDTGVVGLELTAPYMELLTVEARLTLEAQNPETAHDGPEDREEAHVYHRRARAPRGLARGRQRTWSRLPIERPHGSLPLENESPAPQERQGSDMLTLVAPTGFEPALPP